MSIQSLSDGKCEATQKKRSSFFVFSAQKLRSLKDIKGINKEGI